MMAYIPDDTKWYISQIIMECQIEDDPRNVVHINTVLVRADSPEEAFEKAEEIGHDGEDSYLNTDGKRVTFRYRGLQDLLVVYDELEHGSELMFAEEIGVQEAELQAMVTSKSDLSVFQEHQPRDLLIPNYGPKEIIDEVNRLIRDDMS
jgi:Domain of unknown function (DUF4288)